MTHRELARRWLQADLASWTKLVQSGLTADRLFVAETLEYWREDEDLAGVREVRALEALPGPDRTAWIALWAGVNALLAKRKNRPPTPAKNDWIGGEKSRDTVNHIVRTDMFAAPNTATKLKPVRYILHKSQRFGCKINERRDRSGETKSGTGPVSVNWEAKTGQ